MEQKLNSEIIGEIDALINDFRMEEARARLGKLDHGKLPSKDRAAFAALARRVGELKLALKILQPNVFGVGSPSYEDVIELASSVRRLGLINQALILLERAPDLPETHLNRAFCYIHYWDYKKAQVELLKFLDSEKLTPKQQLVGKVNLLTCFVENKELERALTFLDEFEAQCAVESPHLLLNCEETRGQILFKMGKLDEALEALKSAKEKTHDEKGHTSLFIQKWLLLVQIQKGEVAANDPQVAEFKKVIRDEGYWEVLRDFSWQLARMSNDVALMKHVYFGTPYEEFRRHMLNDVDPTLFEDSFHWKDARNPEDLDKIFDFFEVQDVPLAFGKSVHRLLMCLAADFYQPWNVIRLFNHLFPEELFDPTSSLKKVYRLIEQLNQLIEESNLKLELETTRHGYRLRPIPGCIFKINPHMIFADRESFLGEALRIKGIPENFRVADAKDVIPLSTHQWYRAFKAMEEKGYMTLAPGSNSLFTFKKVG